LPALPVTGNRLLHWQHRVMKYDTWGNLVSRRSATGDQHYVYDAENRLIKAEGTGPEGRFTAQYHYDALGRRTRKTVTTQRGTSETRFLWQGYRLLQEQQKDRCRTYVYDPNEAYSPLARIDHLRNDSQGDICWFSTDLNGAPLDVTDEQGNLCWSGQYGSFGEVRYQSDGFSRLLQATTPDHQPLRYAGQYADSETGLHYNLFRYYDPQVGRFTVQDPTGLAGGLNLYQYAPNPLGWIDPWGLTGEWVNPNYINFSQRTISANDYAEMMRNGQWDWNRSPLNVVDVNGQLVTYDNRRLDAALEADLDKVKVTIVDPYSPHPNSSTGKTWWEKFQQRFSDRRNIKAGGVVPDEGLSTRPTTCG
ncbi:RHS repeat-associated core domain-containing protein, partial [Pseudescherichia vulneris]|uniref:RHS repeat-associated core domain-containing protein n=1 Tax=Pseudescherichia vulneris TaxID=566 RepID=UPI0030C94B05